MAGVLTHRKVKGNGNEDEKKTGPKPDGEKWVKREHEKKAVEVLMLCLIKFAQVLDFVMPFILHAYNLINKEAAKHKTKLLNNVLQEWACLVFGVFICLFGGRFPVLVAILVAVRQSGQWPELKKDLKAVCDVMEDVVEVIHEDDIVKALDENSDGKVSLEEIAVGLGEEGKGLLVLAFPLIMKRVDPIILNNALCSIWAISCSIVVTVQSKFAQVIAMGTYVGEIVCGGAARHIIPVLVGHMAPQYKIWADYLMFSFARLCGIVISMCLSHLIGGITTGIYGGSIAAKYTISVGKMYRLTITEDTTQLETLLGYAFGGLGVFCQYDRGFSDKFHFLLMPFTFLENGLGLLVFRGN